MIGTVYRYYSMMFDASLRVVGSEGITVDHVRGIKGGCDVLQEVINGGMTIEQAAEHVNDKDNDELPGIEMTRRIINRAKEATKKEIV